MPGSPLRKIVRKVYRLLASSRLALVLLIAILLSCITGVTVFRGEQAWSLIFTSTWFNGLLVLMVLNVTTNFIGRTWGKKLTLISFGMLLFHLTFLAIFLGVVYNSLFYFNGKLRLSEGETLPNADLQSYDVFHHGRFFDPARLSGQTTLIKMHRGYTVGGEDKRVAYEIAVGQEGAEEHGIIYITNHLDYQGVRYFPDREGYSILVMLYDQMGRDMYGGVIPLQSLRLMNGAYLYITGTRTGPETLPFPYYPETPRMNMLLTYHPSMFEERGGDVTFAVWPFDAEGEGHDPEPAIDPVWPFISLEKYQAGGGGPKPMAEGKVAVGDVFPVDGLLLSATEVRYWVGMDVRYDPGYPIILSSLWIGLAGMVITFIGRLRTRKGRLNASADAENPVV